MSRVQVTIRHFSANNYVNDKDPSAVWNGVSQLPKVFWNKLRKIHLWNIMCTYGWATTSPARSTQPPWLQPSHCLPPLIQVARIVDMTKYCCALTSTGLWVWANWIHKTLQPSRWSCTLMALWTQLPAREHWASTLTLSMVSLGFFAVVVILQLELPVLHKGFWFAIVNHEYNFSLDGQIRRRPWCDPCRLAQLGLVPPG